MNLSAEVWYSPEIDQFFILIGKPYILMQCQEDIDHPATFCEMNPEFFKRFNADGFLQYIGEL